MHSAGKKQHAGAAAAGAAAGAVCSSGLVVASMVAALTLLVIPFTIVEIVMGAQFWSSCPVQHLLPIYLVFSGSLGLCLCALAAMNFLMVFGYCQRRCCVRIKEGRVGLVVCLAVVNCLWLVCGFSFVYTADALHSPGQDSLQSTLPTDSYLYCSASLLGFAKAAVYVRLVLLVCLIGLKRLMYFDLANLTQRRPIVLNNA